MCGDVIDIGQGEQRQVRGCKAALLHRLDEVVQDRLVVIAVANRHSRGARPVTPDKSTAESVSAVKANRVRLP